MRTRAAPILSLAWLLALGCAPAWPPSAPASGPRPPEATAPPPPGECARVVRIEVSKSRRALSAHCEGGGTVEMAAAFGRDPHGPKLAEGDHRTPEGVYRISGPARASRFHRFLPIDYPSPRDAERALAQGRIDRADLGRILEAHLLGEAPPADTPLGGGLGFHGEGPRWRGDSVDLDWTYGCVALSDADIDFLAERVEIGTEVVIEP